MWPANPPPVTKSARLHSGQGGNRSLLWYLFFLCTMPFLHIAFPEFWKSYQTLCFYPMCCAAFYDMLYTVRGVTSLSHSHLRKLARNCPPSRILASKRGALAKHPLANTDPRVTELRIIQNLGTQYVVSLPRAWVERHQAEGRRVYCGVGVNPDGTLLLVPVSIKDGALPKRGQPRNKEASS